MKLECYQVGGLPVRLVPARQDRAWMDAFTDRHAYRCLPLAIANTFGWQMLLPCTVEATYAGGITQNALSISSPDAPELLEHVAQSNFGHGVLTFHTGFLFRTDPDWQLLATGPFNLPQDGVHALTGVIETNWLPYPFTMNWQLTRPGTVRFEKGAPFCQIFPVPIGYLDELTPEIYLLDNAPALKAEYDVFRTQRAAFLAKLKEGDAATIKEAWQKFYFRGKLPTGTPAPKSHTHKLRLADPVDRRTERPPAEAAGAPLAADSVADDAADAATGDRLLARAGQTSAGLAGQTTPGLAGQTTPGLAAEDRPATTAAPSEGQARPAAAGGGQPIRREVWLVSRQEQTRAFLYQDGFLSPAQCETLVRAYERRHHLAAPMKDELFAGRVLWMSSLPEEEREALAIMQQARHAAADRIGAFFDHPRALFDDGPQLVKWPTGYAMPAHADNVDPDGSPNTTPHRLFAAVLYLNAAFEGGVLLFDKLSLGVRPKPGLLVGFRGDGAHSHAVTRITAGERYTMPMWFTDDRAKADPERLKVY